MKKQPFHNFVVDHMTFLVEPELYKTTYALFRIVLGVSPTDLIYEKRRKWPGAKTESSMTFASRIGSTADMNQSIVAVVQPTEPKGQSSHVRTMLKNRGGGCHWQHIALRTPDLLGFHKFAQERGVNFITPVLKDEQEDLIQVFSGEWMLPGGRPTSVFFEFVQRDPSPELLRELENASNREAWFRDKTFLGLYGEKEKEYRRGKPTPFVDHALHRRMAALLKPRELWEIDDSLLDKVEAEMLEYAAQRQRKGRKEPVAA